MLREIAILEPRAHGRGPTSPPPAGPPGPPIALFGRARAPLSVLLLPQGDPRLAALHAPLSEHGLGVTIAVGAETADALDALGAVPDVLITRREDVAPHGEGTARMLMTRWPSLRTLYLARLPLALGLPPVLPAMAARERVLPAPFTAGQFASALATLFPGRGLPASFLAAAPAAAD